VTFKAEITLGQIVEVLVFLAGVIAFARKLGALEQKLNILYGWWENNVLFRHEHPKVERFVR
jgi:hypothetical protein